MSPHPLEGLQQPQPMSAGFMGQAPEGGGRPGSISLAILIDFIIQRTYHELSVLAEL